MLEHAHTGILTTLKADGWPVTLPIWFVALDRTICFSAPSHTRKVARIRHDPRASFLVESGERWAELEAVHLSGTVSAVTDEPSMARIDSALNAKYAAFRTARGSMPDATRAYYTGRTFFRLVPGPRVLTWDNRRIALKEAT